MLDQDVIATRELQFRGDNGIQVPIRARIGRPYAVGPEHSRCDFDVRGPDGEVLVTLDDGVEFRFDGMAPGIDGFDAVQNAFQGLRMVLGRIRDRLSYLDTPGYHGIRLTVTGFSLKMQHLLESLVEDKAQSICDRLEDESTRAETLALIRDPDDI